MIGKTIIVVEVLHLLCSAKTSSEEKSCSTAITLLNLQTSFLFADDNYRIQVRPIYQHNFAIPLIGERRAESAGKSTAR